MKDGLSSGLTGRADTDALGSVPSTMSAAYPKAAVGVPMGPKSVIVKVSLVPPRPSPARLASFELTFVKVPGSVVVSEPTIGMTTSSVADACLPVPSSKVTTCEVPVTFLTVYLTSRRPLRPSRSPGSTGRPSRV